MIWDDHDGDHPKSKTSSDGYETEQASICNYVVGPVSIHSGGHSSVERNRYNEAARGYNTARRRFPAVLIAGLMGFGEKGYFESKPGADQPPQVEF